jgi:MFS family permease
VTEPRRQPVNAALTASPFSRLAIPHALSSAGDSFVTIALAGSLFFSISPSAARGRVALSLVLTMAPFAIVAPLLGPAIDRLEGGRRLMLTLSSAGRCVVALVMAAVVHDLLLFPAAFFALVLSKTHAVTKSSLVPTVVASEDELVEANSKLALLAVIASFLAAGPAVFLLKVFGPAWCLRGAALVFFVGASASLRIIQTRRDVVEKRGEARDAIKDPSILAAATSMGILRATAGFFTFLVAFAFRRSHAPSWWFGVVLAASMAGTMGASALAPYVRRAVREERMLAASLGAVALAAIAAAKWAGRPADSVFAFVLGVGAAAGKLAFDSLVQRDAPAAIQGASFARFEALFQLAWVGGALLPVVVAIPDRVGLFVIALASALAAMTYLASRRPPRSAEVDAG